MKKKALLVSLTAIAASAAVWLAHASDHDDGISDLKSQDVNLTDLYVFREDNQTGNAANSGNLILVMNSNPRSLPGQQYYFSTQARYEFHVTRVPAAGLGVTPTGKNDLTLRFTFGAPDANDRQPITYQLVRGTAGTETPVSAGSTASFADSAADGAGVAGNDIASDGSTLHVFAGLREDPFFFDVERFFQLRESILGGCISAGTCPAFLGTSGAADFTHGYNVNSIVLRVPIAYLQTAGETAFDVWETSSVPVVSYPSST